MGARALAKAIASALARQLGGVGAGAPAWSPSSLFASGEQGVWYDPSDFSTMFQDSAGTTPVTAVEQPDGLMLDKRLGAEFGPELLSNGTFDSGIDGWAAFGSATQSHVGNKLRVTAGASAGGGSSQAITLLPNTYYRLSVQMTPGTGGRARVGVWSGGGFLHDQTFDTGYYPSGSVSFVFKSGSTPSAEIMVLPSTYSAHGATGDYADFDNISVKSLAGNHASQSTSAARPVLSARKNKLLGTEALATQNVTVLAAQHVLSFYGTGTVTLSGVSTAGPLVGTGVGNRVSLTFTPTAGTLTLTVSGSVTQAQLEVVP